jgi:cation-transporting ATPase 13A3/4/5
LPAATPNFFARNYTLILLRLRFKKVMGLKREKTIESSRLETICFDKTGTLTENEMEIKGILIPHPETHVL